VGTLHEDRYTFLIISRSVLLRMADVSFGQKLCRKSKHIICSITFLKSCLYEIMWKNIVEPDWPQITIRRMCIEYWITKPTNTHSEYVILIAFPLQQFLHERSSMIRYTYITCLVYNTIINIQSILKHIYVQYHTGCMSGYNNYSFLFVSSPRNVW
jgi:hypothetical protein